MTPYTSFVAVEERKEGEDLRPTGPSITELLDKESVDILPYIEWEKRIGEETEVSNMTRDARKPVFGVSHQVQHKPGCAITEYG